MTALGLKPQLRVIEGGSGTFRQPLDEATQADNERRNWLIYWLPGLHPLSR
jgi:hypothetical protein